MEYRAYVNRDKAPVGEMFWELFPNYTWEDFNRDIAKITSSHQQEIFVALDKEKHVGVAHVSIRHDYVEGSNSSPVGYLEWIFVKKDSRNIGVARKLEWLCENWAKEKWCREMGSDTWLWNTQSQKFHEKLWFTEDDRLVHYIKDIT